MKKLLILIFCVIIGFLGAQNIWINELHYDNTGTDVGEFIEVVLENAASYNLVDFTVSFYNGNDQMVYGSVALDQFTYGVTVENFTIYFHYYAGIQNGSPDGIAIDYQGTLIPGQFLSYEGEFVALDGPALGVTSTDIGVEEGSSTPAGESLQLQGVGSMYNNFAWEGPVTESPGAVNINQILGEITEPMITVLSPNGGEEWEQGSTHNVLWSSINFTDNVKIELDQVWLRNREVLVSSTENDGIWEWSIPVDQEVSDYYSIIISDAADGDPWDDSNSAFSIIPMASVIDVATIAELRAGIQGTQVYRLTGEAILTYQQDFRNQKFLQDDTAGIMIDDDPGVIATLYEIGDGIINLTGTLTEYGGMIEFQPTSDSGVINSTGNMIDPDIITLAQFNASFEDYESELVEIQNAVFLDTGVFAVGQVYAISDDSREQANFRTTFYDANYIGTNIPSVPVHLTVICNSRSEGNFVTSRWLDDIVPAGSEEVITVIVPNGGEAWYQGTTQAITWNSYNFTGSVKIELLINGQNPAVLIAETEDDGTWDWAIPAGQPVGDNYSVRISDAADGLPWDESDAYFSILQQVPQPEEGDIIITEIMQNPAAVNDTDGEWFEIYNTTAAVIDINGWVIKDNDTDIHTINNEGPLNITAYDYLVLGINQDIFTNGGLTVDYQYADFTLANGFDEVVLLWVDGTTEIDRVEYDDGASFPDPSGASMALNPYFMNYEDNDLGTYWYTSYTPYGDGDYGTPGEENPEPLNPPGAASDPSPGDGDIQVPINSDLAWSNGANTITVDLYFDTADPPLVLVLDNVPAVEFFDPGILDYDTTYYWQVICRNPGGETPADIWSFTTAPQSDNDPDDLIGITALIGNHPNPFNPHTRICFNLGENQRVLISIFNLKGVLITNLLNEEYPAGYHEIVWDGKNYSGTEMPSGIYLYRMKTDSYSELRKMLLIK